MLVDTVTKAVQSARLIFPLCLNDDNNRNLTICWKKRMETALFFQVNAIKSHTAAATGKELTSIQTGIFQNIPGSKQKKNLFFFKHRELLKTVISCKSTITTAGMEKLQENSRIQRVFCNSKEGESRLEILPNQNKGGEDHQPVSFRGFSRHFRK